MKLSIRSPVVIPKTQTPRAASPAGSAFLGVVPWSAVLGFGAAPAEPPQPEYLLAPGDILKISRVSRIPT